MSKEIYNFTEDINCTIYDSRAYVYVAIASVASAFVSLLAGCFVIVILILFKKHHFFSQRLILYLAITTLLASISTIVHRVDYNNQESEFYVNFCRFGGFLEQNTSWMQLNAISSITIYLFVNAIFKKGTEKLEPLYVFLIFFFPLLFNWIPFIQGSYGRAGAWCWIRSKERGTCNDFILGRWLQFILWFIPLYIILVILIGLYVTILISLNRANRQWANEPSSMKSKTFRKLAKNNLIPLIAYPLIYFLLNIPAFMNRVQNYVHPNDPELALWYLSALISPLQGGVIAIAYTLDPGTRKRLNWIEIKAAMKRWVQKERYEEYPLEYLAVTESFSPKPI